MKKSFVRAFIACACMLITALSFSGCSESENTVPSEPVDIIPGNPAPDFTVELNNGGKFTLSKAKGKVIVLNFWATWCGPCCREMPAFQRLSEKYIGRVQVVAVDYAESPKTVDEFVANGGYTFSFGYDTDGKISDLYPTDGIPYTIIIDRNGNITQTFIGAGSAEKQYQLYEKAIEEAFNEEYQTD